MSDKLLSYGSCVSIFQPNLQRNFATVSPVNLISGPDSSQLYSWVGSISYTSQPSIAFGTIDRWRYDQNDRMPLNRDQWVLWSTGTAETVRIKEVEKFDILSHWSDGLPFEIQICAPTWARIYVDEMVNKIK